MALKLRKPEPSEVLFGDNFLIGTDIHADLTGFQDALKLANWNVDNEKLVIIGDEWDRGDKALETSLFLETYGVIRIQSNHGWKHARYAFHQSNEPNKKNPVKVSAEMADTINQLGDVYFKYALEMLQFPYYLPFEDSQGQGYLVHAGINPFDKIEDQEPDKILVRRYHPSPKEYLEKENDEHKYWQRSYTGHLGTIIHGHSVCPSHDFHGNKWVFSLDQGGVLGTLAPWIGKHSVLRLGSRTVFSSPGSPEAESHYRSILYSNDTK
jgi:hypothetical protein